MNVIYPPILDYHFMMQRPQHLMAQFARHGHRVFFCNQTQKPGEPLELVEPHLHLVHDHAAFLREVAPYLEATLVWCTWPKLHNSLAPYHPSFVVFDCVDDFPAWRPYEEAMLAQSDAVVVTSEALLARLHDRHPHVTLIPNGADVAHFANRSGPPPSDLPPGPTAGFVGAWGRWVDSALIERAASRLPQWQFVIIGPPFGGKQVNRPNIHFLGWRPYADLPSYLHQFNAALIPFRHDQVTQAAHPIKLWEYLAVGLPVVSTPLPEVMPYRHLVEVAETPLQFAEALARAAGAHLPDQVEARQNLARQHTWEQRYRQIVRAIPALRAN